MRKNILLFPVLFLLGIPTIFSDPVCNSNEKLFLAGQDLNGQEWQKICGPSTTPRISEVKLDGSYYLPTAESLNGLEPSPENGFLIEYIYGSAEGVYDTYIPNPLKQYRYKYDSYESNGKYLGNGIWQVPVPKIDYGKQFVHMTLFCVDNSKCSNSGITSSHTYQALYVKKIDYCKDTDNGIDYYSDGTIEIIDKDDLCIGNKLYEQYCDQDGNPSTEIYECPYGCNNGKCNREFTQCIDTDDGSDYNIKGTTSNNQGNSATDYCSSKGNLYNLVEFKCGSNGEILSEYYLCPKGCQDGACVISDEPNLKYYPAIFVKENKLDSMIVVGDKASSSDVIAQSVLISFFGNIDVQTKGTAKLASEVSDLNQNIISVGNPCVNEISAKIMNNPVPCDKDFQKGKGYIKLYKNNEFFHLIVAGYSDVGTKKAAEILANYNNYKFQGNEYVVDVEELVLEVEEKVNITKIEVAEKESQKTGLQPQELLNKTEIEEEQEKPEKANIENEKPKQIVKEKTNVINKIIIWFLSLFK